MGRFFVLVVDDQREVARLVRVSLEELLGEHLDVRDVPSGEEALLELALRPADLLIVDLGLPGLQGHELIARVHRTHPHTRFIVLTGWDEGQARRTLRQLPVEEVLFKPVNIVDLTAAVRDALGLVEEPAEDETAAETGTLSYAESNQHLADLLAEARASNQVESVALLDGEGRVLMRSPGALPTEVTEGLRRPLVYLHGAGLDLARALGQGLPQQIFYFQGMEWEYALTPVATYYMLLWVAPLPTDETPVLLAHAVAMRHLVREVREVLARMGILEHTHQGELHGAREVDMTSDLILPPESEDLGTPAEKARATSELELDDNVAALLESLDTLDLNQANLDPDAFWQEVATHKGTDLLRIDADALSYDEARRLGLVPDDSSGES